MHPVDEIDQQADEHPDDQPDPGVPGQRAHQGTRQEITPIGPVNQMPGALNGRWTSGCVIRMTRTPAETTAKAKRVPIEVSSPAMLIGMVAGRDHHDQARDDRRDPGRTEAGVDLGDGRAAAGRRGPSNRRSAAGSGASPGSPS